MEQNETSNHNLLEVAATILRERYPRGTRLLVGTKVYTTPDAVTKIWGGYSIRTVPYSENFSCFPNLALQESYKICALVTVQEVVIGNGYIKMVVIFEGYFAKQGNTFHQVVKTEESGDFLNFFLTQRPMLLI